MEIPQIVGTYIDAFCRRDVDAWLATFAPDGTLSDPATDQQPFAGQALKDVVGGFFAGFPDAATETITAYAITADLVVWRWVIRGTHTGSYRSLTPTGRHLNLPGCEFLVVRDGLVQRVEGYFDRLNILQQLGVAPTPVQAS